MLWRRHWFTQRNVILECVLSWAFGSKCSEEVKHSVSTRKVYRAHGKVCGVDESALLIAILGHLQGAEENRTGHLGQ